MINQTIEVKTETFSGPKGLFLDLKGPPMIKNIFENDSGPPGRIWTPIYAGDVE